DLRDYAAHGGVFPLIVAGVGPVGTVGVSGLPQVQDHEFVVQQLERFLAAR
ncbi:MAG: heme-binding protein, partial [Actinomycetota bacterium]